MYVLKQYVPSDQTLSPSHQKSLLPISYLVALRSSFYSKTPDAIVIFVVGYLLYFLRCSGISKYRIWITVVLFRIFFGDFVFTYDVW